MGSVCSESLDRRDVAGQWQWWMRQAIAEPHDDEGDDRSTDRAV